MKRGWLLWKENRLHVVDDGTEIAIEGPGEIGAAVVDDLAFTVARYGLLAFPRGQSVSCWRSEAGDVSKFLELPPMPDRGEMTDLGLHPRYGIITMLRGGIALVGDHARWSSNEVPEGTRWVAFDDAGALWAAGSRPSERVPGARTEIAAWRRDPGGAWRDVPISLSFFDALKAIRGGGFESLSGIDPSIEPVVLAAECAWPLDDPSWFLYVRHAGKFTVQKLRGRRLARLDRDTADVPWAFTTDGELWTFDGRRFRAAGLAAPLAHALRLRTNETRSVQLAVARPFIRGVVTIWREGHRHGHLTIASDDDGRNWELGERIEWPSPHRFIAGFLIE